MAQTNIHYPGESTVMKKKQSNVLPDDIREYRLVASPDEAVLEKVRLEKQHFINRYEQKKLVSISSDITLVSFLAKELMEETLIRWVQRVCSRQHSFPVMLNNYSGRPPHTIYLRVQDPLPFRHLAKQLNVVDDYVKANGCPAAQFTMYPYLGIAGCLPEALYYKAMFEYSKRSFCETFIVNELRLLRKEDMGQYKVVNVFRLQPPGSE